MEPIEFLSGVLVVSADPARLSDFYRESLGVPLKREEHEELTQLGPDWFDYLEGRKRQGIDVITRSKVVRQAAGTNDRNIADAG
jgi:hypothetical protein